MFKDEIVAKKRPLAFTRGAKRRMDEKAASFFAVLERLDGSARQKV
jgi:hypothetical protein